MCGCVYIYLFTGVSLYLYRWLREHLRFFRDSAVMSLQVCHSFHTRGGVRGWGRGPADGKDGSESWMSLINRRPVCLLKGPLLEDLGRTVLRG